jgi:DNA-binding transcriptional LysR family regulator
MDLRQMRYFLAVAEHLHFHRAAEALHLSQPSLSQQIRLLEEEIGAALFERANRKVQLTQAGEALVPRVRALLRGVEEAVHEARRIDRGLSGLLTLCFGSAALLGVLPAALKDFQIQAPDVELQLKECEAKEQIASLLARGADIGFVHAQLEDEQLDSKVIQRDQLIAALPAEAAGEGPVDLARFGDYAAIMPSPFTASGYAHHVQQAYRMAGVRPRKFLHTALILGGVHLVAAGMGVALVPSSFQSIAVPGVLYRPLLQPAPAVELLAVWRRDSSSKSLLRFLAILDALAPSGGEGCAQ